MCVVYDVYRLVVKFGEEASGRRELVFGEGRYDGLLGASASSDPHLVSTMPSSMGAMVPTLGVRQARVFALLLN